MKVMPASLMCCLVLLAAPAPAADRITGRDFATRSVVYAPEAMAATSHPLATQIALDVMKQGGSAVDAAIAANAALGLMEPTGNGIGGDLFAIVWDPKTQKLHGYNGSGRSPRGLTLKWFQDNGHESVPSHGPLPVTVPGAVDGWFALHGRFGKLPMAEVLAPTVRYAREGHPVHDTITYYWNRSVPLLSKWPGFSEQFTIDGRAPRTGELWKNPNLANTLETIGRDGRDAFYKGDIARRIDAYFRENDGFLRYEDLAAHEGEWVEPASANYRGVDVWELPPNGQGIAALQILEILEGFDFSKIDFGSAEHVHLFVEAKKLAFADRARFYADPDFNKLPIDGLISKEYGDRQRARINMQRAATNVDPGDPILSKGDTIYLTVVDKDRNCCSFIQSNYHGFGSQIVPGDVGFVLQNRGQLFNLDPAHLNTLEPHKRPFHTIIPAFVTRDGKPFFCFGVMGGDMQPQGHVQILMNLIDFGMNVQAAGDAARVNHVGSQTPTGTPMWESGGEVGVESGITPEVRADLQRRGHILREAPGSFGGYQGILIDWKNGTLHGATETRKDGVAAGY